MLNDGNALLRRVANLPRGGIRCYPHGEVLLLLLHLVQRAVILRVGQVRFVKHVITIIGIVECDAQLSDTFNGVRSGLSHWVVIPVSNMGSRREALMALILPKWL